MGKKIRNILLLGAAIGAAAAGTYYYLNKKELEAFDEDDDDFDDFDDFDEDGDTAASLDPSDASSRNYVPLRFDNGDDTPAAGDDKTNDSESVEEFFDDEDEEINDESPVGTEEDE